MTKSHICDIKLLRFPPANPKLGGAYPRTRYSVLCVGDSVENCEVLNEMRNGSRENFEKMVRLFRTAMSSGLPLHNKKKAQVLKGTKVIVLKATAKTGTNLRVFSFQDANRFVCVEANASKTDDDPMPYAERVMKFREKYFEAKDAKSVEIIEMDD